MKPYTETDDFQALHDRNRLEYYLGECYSWRMRKCNEMLQTIADMMQAELHRRISA